VSGLGPGGVDLLLTDANNCAAGAGTELSEPERDDWTMQGNSSTNAAIDFIGTTDSSDIVLKSNNHERLRIKANGEVYVDALKGSGGMLIADTNGRLMNNNAMVAPCNGPTNIPAWHFTSGQNTLFTCSDVPVGIGTGYLSAFPAGYGLIVEGKVGVREVHVRANGLTWPDYVFEKDYNLMPLEQLESYIAKNKHLPDMPSASQIEQNGMNLSEIITLQQKKIEELFLYIMELEKRMNNK